MQSRVSEFVRQKIMEAVAGVCYEITIANAYNTQPFVTADPREVNGREEDHVVMIMPAAETVTSVGVGGCHNMSLELVVYGFSQVKDSNPTEELNKLLQDVRTAIHSNLREITESVGRGLAFEFGDLETDEGALAFEGRASFAQTMYYGYKNNAKTW